MCDCSLKPVHSPKTECYGVQKTLSEPIFTPQTIKTMCENATHNGAFKHVKSCMAGYHAGMNMRLSQAQKTNSCLMKDLPNTNILPHLQKACKAEYGTVHPDHYSKQDYMKGCGMGYLNQDTDMANPMYNQACGRCSGDTNVVRSGLPSNSSDLGRCVYHDYGE
jgi:hypothetical protein